MINPEVPILPNPAAPPPLHIARMHVTYYETSSSLTPIGPPDRPLNRLLHRRHPPILEPLKQYQLGGSAEGSEDPVELLGGETASGGTVLSRGGTELGLVDLNEGAGKVEIGEDEGGKVGVASVAEEGVEIW